MAQKYLLVTLTLISVLFPLVIICDNPLSSYEVLLSWKNLDYKWPAPQTKERLLTTKEYIPENNVITGIKVRGSKIYLTVPRWRLGVPSTLNVVDLKDQSGAVPGAPLLVPYPNWDMQQVGNCNAFQYVQSMEIDRWGRMWVIDVGRVNIFQNKEAKCKAKIVLIDLEKDEIIHKYEFPEEVVNPKTNFLNDIVVECGEGDDDKSKCVGYITDSLDGKLVVYNLKEERSWFVRHRSMLADSNALKMNILGGNYSFNVNIDGIALSPRSSGHDRVYYCPLSSLSLCSVPTSILKESVNGVTLRDGDVTTHTTKRSSQADGLAMDANGLLFYGLLQNNSVVYVNTTASSPTSDPFKKEVLLVQNDVDLQWPDTFAFDDYGYLYTVTNRIQRFITNSYDWSEVNFRVARIFIGSLSYQYRKEDKVQEDKNIFVTPSPSEVGNALPSNPTNLDNNAPDTPVGVRVDGRERYGHDDQSHEGDNQLGDGHHHSHQHGHVYGTEDSKRESTATSSAPVKNEYLPVVIFLTVLMYNLMLNP